MQHIQVTLNLFKSVSGGSILSCLLVQLVQVSSEGKESNTEDPCENCCEVRTSNVVHGLAQLWDDVMNHVTSTRVLVLGIDVFLAFDRFFVKLFANLGNSLVVVVVVVIVVVVVSIVVFSIVVVVFLVVVCSARQAG